MCVVVARTANNDFPLLVATRTTQVVMDKLPEQNMTFAPTAFSSIQGHWSKKAKNLNV